MSGSSLPLLYTVKQENVSEGTHRHLVSSEVIYIEFDAFYILFGDAVPQVNASPCLYSFSIQLFYTDLYSAGIGVYYKSAL
jgi:hypothetical protein